MGCVSWWVPQNRPAGTYWWYAHVCTRLQQKPTGPSGASTRYIVTRAKQMTLCTHFTFPKPLPQTGSKIHDECLTHCVCKHVISFIHSAACQMSPNPHLSFVDSMLGQGEFHLMKQRRWVITLHWVTHTYWVYHIWGILKLRVVY